MTTASNCWCRDLKAGVTVSFEGDAPPKHKTSDPLCHHHTRIPRVDRDIVVHVDSMHPIGLAQRVALERTLQDKRDRGEQVLGRAKDTSARAMLDETYVSPSPSRRLCEIEPIQSVPGVWVVYDWDNGPYVISIHPSSDAAAKATAGTGYGRIGFVEFGVEFRLAVNTWEGR